LPKKSEIGLLPPRRVPLSAAQYDEAVSLLAELVLGAAEAKRRGVRSSGVIDGASGSALGGVIPSRRSGRRGVRRR